MKKEIRQKINVGMFFKKLFSIDNELTADQACKISKYGKDLDFDRIVKLKIDDINSQIRNKLEFSRYEKMLNLLVPKDQIELYDKLKEHYESKGFKVFYADKTNLPELGENKYLFLSWDIDTEKKIL